MTDRLYPLPVEDTDFRPPEFEDVEPAAGQHPMMRHVEWDPIHGTVRMEAPKVVDHRPMRRPIAPAP